MLTGSAKIKTMEAQCKEPPLPQPKPLNLTGVYEVEYPGPPREGGKLIKVKMDGEVNQREKEIGKKKGEGKRRRE
jgi:hypothetical protein